MLEKSTIRRGEGAPVRGQDDFDASQPLSFADNMTEVRFSRAALCPVAFFSAYNVIIRP